jgi:hypothetical protein
MVTGRRAKFDIIIPRRRRTDVIISERSLDCGFGHRLRRNAQLDEAVAKPRFPAMRRRGNLRYA